MIGFQFVKSTKTFKPQKQNFIINQNMNKTTTEK